MFSPYFAGIKGRVELAVTALMADYPSLRTYSMRPGMVDPRLDPNVLAAQKPRMGVVKKVGYVALGPVIKTAMPNTYSDTAWLGEFLVDLALRDGEPIQADGMEGDGRIIPNKTAKVLTRRWKSEASTGKA